MGCVMGYAWDGCVMRYVWDEVCGCGIGVWEYV